MPRRPRPLTPREQAAWRLFLRAHQAVITRLENELVAEHAMTLGEYEVLVYLSEAPGRRLRMSELAASVMLSRSGLTRLVDRLTAEELVTREPCESDHRGTYAVLTDAGFARLETAYPTHLRGVRAYVIDVLGAGDISVLATLLSRVVDASEERIAVGA